MSRYQSTESGDAGKEQDQWAENAPRYWYASFQDSRKPNASISNLRALYHNTAPHYHAEYANCVWNLARLHEQCDDGVLDPYQPFLVLGGGGYGSFGITESQYQVLAASPIFDPAKYAATLRSIEAILETSRSASNLPFVAVGGLATYLGLPDAEFQISYGADAKAQFEAAVAELARKKAVERENMPDLSEVLAALGPEPAIYGGDVAEQARGEEGVVTHSPTARSGDVAFSESFEGFAITRVESEEVNDLNSDMDGHYDIDAPMAVPVTVTSEVPDEDLNLQEVGRLYRRVLNDMVAEIPTAVPQFVTFPAPAGVDKTQIASAPIGVLLPINPIMKGQLTKILGMYRYQDSAWRLARFNVSSPRHGKGLAIELDACPWCGGLPNSPALGTTTCTCVNMSIPGYGWDHNRPINLCGYVVDAMGDAVPESARMAAICLPYSPFMSAYVLPATDGGWKPYRVARSPSKPIWDRIHPLAADHLPAVMWSDYGGNVVKRVSVSEFAELAIDLLAYDIFDVEYTLVVKANGQRGVMVWIPGLRAYALNFDANERIATCNAYIGAVAKWYYHQRSPIKALIRMVMHFGGAVMARDLYAYLYGWGREVRVPPGETPTVATLVQLCLAMVHPEEVIKLGKQGVLFPAEDASRYFPAIDIWHVYWAWEMEQDDPDYDPRGPELIDL